jgi:Phage integrase family
LRVRLRKQKLLKLKIRSGVGKAYGPEEKTRLMEHAKQARSPHIYPALMMALNAGMRDAEMKGLTWSQVNFEKRYLAVGRSKTEAGEGRTIPLNSALYEALTSYANWYVLRFGEIRPEWYVFPFGKPRPKDPTRPVTTLKTAWRNLRQKAKVTGRWHDNRHTLITDLAESGASDQTIMDIAGHVSKQMLKHYSHIRMEAKRKALESIVQQNGPAASPAEPKQDHSPAPTVVQEVEEDYPQKSPQSSHSNKICSGKKDAKSLKRFGSSGRIRTYNPSVNSQRVPPWIPTAVTSRAWASIMPTN